jgi:hypothetical protein
MRKSLVVTGTALMLVAGGAGVTQAQSSRHVLRFTDITTREVGYGANTYAAAATEKAHGRVIGFSVVSGRVDPKKNTVRLKVAITLKGGILYARFPSQPANKPAIRGKVTSGTGSFRGATGRIVSTTVTNARSKVRVVYYN